VRALKSLEPIVQLALTDFDLSDEGWMFTGRNGSESAEPLYGFTHLKQLYLKADPDYVKEGRGRVVVPTLWDKKLETIVSNESSEM
jgi:glutathionyl-hydroquinone reductase